MSGSSQPTQNRWLRIALAVFGLIAVFVNIAAISIYGVNLTPTPLTISGNLLGAIVLILFLHQVYIRFYNPLNEKSSPTD